MGKMIEKNTPQNVIPIAATRGLGYTEAEAMLGDLISKDRVSDTAIRVARDHMIQFARKLPNMLPSVDEPENAETCATPLGQSGMTCALQADHGGVCAASPNGNWNEGWISEPPLPVAAFVDPLDNDQFATLLSTLDAKIKASSDDTLELAWLLTLKIEISRLRTENSKLSAKLTQPLEDIETAAIAIAMNRLRHCRPPVRWPAGPEDRLSGRDGTVPITWDAAEQYREDAARSEAHTSELQSLMRISYAYFCLNKNIQT